MSRIVAEANSASLRICHEQERIEKRHAVKQYRGRKEEERQKKNNEARVEGESNRRKYTTHTHTCIHIRAHTRILNLGSMVREITQNIKFNTWLVNVRTPCTTQLHSNGNKEQRDTDPTKTHSFKRIGCYRLEFIISATEISQSIK